MTYRMTAASFVFLFAVLGDARGRTQTNQAAQPPAATAAPAHVQRILTKDPEYMKLLAPPLGNDFLQTYSQGYREKSAEIEARIADIGDESLRSRARSDEWGRVLKKDRDRFTNEAEVTFNQARVSFLEKHQEALFEIGRVSYDETNTSLVMQTSPAAPVEANFRVVMKAATINQIYEMFHQIAAHDIDQKAHEYVAKAGPGSTCANNPDWCYKFGKDDIERNLRSERMVVVAQGDLGEKRIDRLFLVDYDTETVLLDLRAHISALHSAAWRFTVGVVATAPTEPPPAQAQASPAAVASTEPAPSPDENMEAAKSGNTGESAPDTPISTSNPPTRISVPGKVTAAAIVDRTTPEYPPQARAGHLQGEVLLHAIINKEGKISELQVLSGDDVLAKSALEAVRQWRYKPMLVDGEPAEVDTTITVKFSLSD
jgi:TonB family protein